MNQTKFDVFISYRRVDSEGRTSGRDIARTIKLELEKRGYGVFFDYSEIKDNEFEDTILPAIHNSKVFIIVLSKDAPPDYYSNHYIMDEIRLSYY